MADDDMERGVYAKFEVRRTDGRDAPGEKHENCFLFVLDVDHDPLAMGALLAYAEAAQEAGYTELAADLFAYLDGDDSIRDKL